MYPKVIVDLSKLAHNVRQIINICAEHEIEILGVTKVFSGDPHIAEILVDNGIRMLGDARLKNIEKYKYLDCEKWLIRMPGVSQAEEVVSLCDVSLNSELNTLCALNDAALKQNKKHKVVLMADLGDIREGCYQEADFAECADFVKRAKGLELYGIGTNLTCFSFVQPDKEKLTRLVELGEKYDTGVYVSGGNSATVKLMLEGEIPAGVNSLRLGEAVLFGRERAGYNYLDGMYNDAFCLEAEVIECKQKPSMPQGTIGANSYGEIPVFEDKGERLRAICALGRQDIDEQTMWPVDSGLEIIGASSDHLVVDVTDAKRTYKSGDIIKFRLGYFATMRAFTSGYVGKEYR